MLLEKIAHATKRNVCYFASIPSERQKILRGYVKQIFGESRP